MSTRDRILALYTHGDIDAFHVAAVLGIDVADVERSLADPTFTPPEVSASWVPTGDIGGTSDDAVVETVKGGETPLTADQNLADVASAPAARTSLGLGSAATHATTDFDAAGAATSAAATEAARAEAAEALLIPLAQKAAANGVATLDGASKLPASQLTVDALEYKGSWNASTNSPALANGTGSPGDFYIVSTGGNAGPVTAAAGDYVVLNPSLVWEDIPVGATGKVASFNTRTGAVTLSKADVTGTGLVASDVSADVSGAAATAQAASLQKTSNLGDVANAATARTNLGLGSVATHPATDFDAAGTSAAETARAETAEALLAQGLVPTAVKTSAYNAIAADFIPVDISGGAVPVTLPTAPADKTRIGVKVVKVSGTPGSTSCSVAAGGSDVFNVAAGSTTLTLTALFQGVLLQYKASGGIWYVSTADSPIGVALGAAKLGTDGTVGGPSGSALTGSVATDSWAPSVKDGSIDLSTALQAAIDTATGFLGIPQGTYQLKNVYITSGVVLRVAPGTIFTLPASASANDSIFYVASKSNTATTYATDLGICGGPFTLDISAPGGGSIFQAIRFTNCKRWIFENCHIISGGSPTGAAIFAPNNAWQGNTVGGGQLPLLPREGIIRNISSDGNQRGGGTLQIGGLVDSVIERIAGTGGVSVRFETDQTPGGVAYGLIDNVSVDGYSCDQGNNPLHFAPHSQTIRNVRAVRGRATGCEVGTYLGPISTSTFTDITIDGIAIDGTGAGANNPITGHTEGIYVESGSSAYMDRIKVRRARVLSVTGTDFGTGNNLEYDDCTSSGATTAGTSFRFGSRATSAYLRYLRNGGVTVYESIPRELVTGAGFVLSTGVQQIVALPLPPGANVSILTFVNRNTTLVAGTTNHLWAVLFDPTGAVVSQSADVTAPVWASASAQDFTLQAAQTNLPGGLYYAGIMLSMVGGTPTFPNMAGNTIQPQVLVGVPLGSMKKLSGTSGSSLTTTAAAINPSTMTVTNNMLYAAAR